MVYVLLVNQENETWPDAEKGNLRLVSLIHKLFLGQEKGFDECLAYFQAEEEGGFQLMKHGSDCLRGLPSNLTYAMS